jgi:hypothetical protein
MYLMFNPLSPEGREKRENERTGEKHYVLGADTKRFPHWRFPSRVLGRRKPFSPKCYH